MGAAGRSRVSLELDQGDGAISGRLDDGERTVEFKGWLTLAAALERMRPGRDAKVTPPAASSLPAARARPGP